MIFSSYLYDTISLALHLSTFLTNDKSRSKMNFQILLEIQNNFLHRLNSMSIDDDLNLQYKYDLLVHKCRLAPIASNVDDYLACLKQLQEVIDTLQEVDNIYPLNPVQLEFPSFPPITIKIDHRRIQSTEIYELYLNHGEYLCDIGYQVEGINYMENGLEMILSERNGQ